MSIVPNSSNLPILPQNAQNRSNSHSAPPSQPLANPPISPTPVTVHPTHLPPRPLSPRQLNAIPLLLQGLSDTQVAQRTGVRRESICRWRNQHPLFIAELNRQRQLLHASTIDRYHHLLQNSMAFIEKFQQSPGQPWLQEQVHLATTLIRSASRRTLSSPPPPSTNPDEILSLLLSQNLPPSPDDSPDDDAPPSPQVASSQ